LATSFPPLKQGGRARLSLASPARVQTALRDRSRRRYAAGGDAYDINNRFCFNRCPVNHAFCIRAIDPLTLSSCSPPSRASPHFTSSPSHSYLSPLNRHSSDHIRKDHTISSKQKQAAASTPRQSAAHTTVERQINDPSLPPPPCSNQASHSKLRTRTHPHRNSLPSSRDVSLLTEAPHLDKGVPDPHLERMGRGVGGGTLGLDAKLDEVWAGEVAGRRKEGKGRRERRTTGQQVERLQTSGYHSVQEKT
jgi:hypothetical protein